MNEAERRVLLESAEVRRDELAREHGWRSREEKEASQELLDLQRSTAADTGAPYAVRFDLGVQWSTGAPMPTLIAGYRTWLAFYLNDSKPSGTFEEPRERDSDHDLGIGVVEFFHARSVQMGSASNETLHGHPLFGSGLEYYSAHVVKNSRWIEEQKSIDSVHRRYREENWAECVHYLLAFHDEIFECIATGFKTEETNESLTAAVSRLAATAVT